MALSAKLSYQFLRCLFWSDRVSAGKDIDGSITAFWPGVNKQVGFSQNYRPAYPVGIELMKGFPQDSSPGFAGRRWQHSFEKAQVI
jgi:hypothetical protein